jgi:hypothetical protein
VTVSVAVLVADLVEEAFPSGATAASGMIAM